MKYTKAVSETTKMTVETAQLEGQLASFLVGDYNEGQKLAIVDEGVLKYLTSLLPKASTYDIISRFKNNLDSNGGLEKAVKEAKEFVAFHETVNLLKVYFNPRAEIAFNEPFNVAKPEPSITEVTAEYNRLGEIIRKWEQKKKYEGLSPDEAHEQSINDLGNDEPETVVVR